MAEEGPDTLLRAVTVLRELADEAPRDIQDEWDRLLDALAGLDAALDAAGVDASTYDAERPPESVTEEQQQAIARAADELATQETVAAWEGVKQHAERLQDTAVPVSAQAEPIAAPHEVLTRLTRHHHRRPAEGIRDSWPCLL